ncbi:MAG: PucR family transcriptional regulator [Frankiales bacterium]|nr:PucR family transcriptional regulator [Frankiales bacterium]
MSELALERSILDALHERLPEVAERTVTAVTGEVPEYADAFSGEMGATIQGAVQMALAGFLRLASRSGDLTPLGPAREGAYALGRGEARSGRTVDALLSAYRVGARVAWRELSTTAVESGLGSETVAQFAELVFAYIDDLSAASVAGHNDQLATSGRVRQRYRERLGLALLNGAPSDALADSAQRADWEPPKLLTVVLVPSARTRDTMAVLDARTLVVPGDLVGLDQTDVLLAPDPRRSLLRALAGRAAVVGPTREWGAAASSYRRALRAVDLQNGPDLLDTEAHLATLVLTADAEALHDLRSQVLEPLAALRPGTAERLAETLRSWLLHQGRRDDVAAELHVHAQTVRYRMTQLRELFGEQLADPEVVLRLTVALAQPAS